MVANFRLLKPKGQEPEREHIQQKKTMMLIEFWLQYCDNICHDFVYCVSIVHFVGHVQVRQFLLT